ncbi:winged helix-turn-helix domain-containing protein [Rugamonas sp.]|uniref:ATP-binding protein n=1 Tax=Rugamonas sp. TaxID=1926287 RepID=UPI0025FC00A0|nr:winged helix-turn-helix domain-containing protein [Rugamonas sp.]
MTVSVHPAAAAPPSLAGSDYRFGPYLLMPAQRCLLNAGGAVRLSKRAFDLLTALVERAGSVVSHGNLIARAWPTTVVEEVNLRVHISALRGVLRAGGASQRYIDNVPGQGYCFVAPVAVLEAPPVAAGETAALLGRDCEIARLAADVPRLRFISLVGTGGIGKTALAQAVGARLAAQGEFRVCHIDFGALGDGGAALGVLARAAGLAPMAERDVVAALALGWSNRPLLVVLDSCEYQIQEAAALADALLAHVPGVALLATSREPLLAHGESIVRPPPLALPPRWPGMGAADVQGYPAVALFERSARARQKDFVLRDADAAALAALCQRLDGLPLAIALAAELIESFGIDELLDKRHDRFCMLVADVAPRPARHRTLWASLEWTFQRLPLREQIVLRRMSVFRLSFSIADATAAIRCTRLAPADILDILMALVAKSLVNVEPGEGGTRYRLLTTTRTFMFEKLCAAGEQGLGMAGVDGAMEAYAAAAQAPVHAR